MKRNLKIHLGEHIKRANLRGIDVDSFNPLWLTLKIYVCDGFNDVSFAQLFHRSNCVRCTVSMNEVEEHFCNKLLSNIGCMNGHLSKIHSVQKSQRNRSKYIRGILKPIFDRGSSSQGKKDERQRNESSESSIEEEIKDASESGPNKTERAEVSSGVSKKMLEKYRE
jgi:hypothetical protein